MAAKRGNKGGNDFLVWAFIALVVLSMTKGKDWLSNAVADPKLPHPEATATLASLDAIPVSKTQAQGYERDAFGPAWSDDNDAPGGHNGCDTRNDILKSSLQGVVFKNGSTCVVQSGVLPHDPYTGRDNVTWKRGRTTSAALQVDHIVPLSWAWKNGANEWTPEQRRNFANDQDSVLLLADGPENMGKGDKGPSEWMVPENPEYRCKYASQWVSILNEYKLSAPKEDIEALRSTLEACK